MSRARGAAGRVMIPLAVAAIGCAPDDAPRSALVRTDSAGVSTVRSVEPSGAAAAWTLSEEPVLRIGSVARAGDVLFRVFSARRLADGRILVSNSGAQELRIHDASGALELSFGGEGEGPGEFNGFSSMTIVGLDAGTVAVRDAGNDRVNVFSLDGGFVRSISHAAQPGHGRPAVLGTFADRDWLASMPVGSGTLGGEVGDRIDMEIALFRYDLDGSAARRITTADARPRIVNSLGGGAIHYPFVPLTPEPVFAVAGAALLLADPGGSAELLRFDADGAIGAIFRWAAPRTAVSDIWVRFAAEFLEDVSESRRPAYARLLAIRDQPVPETVPAVGSLLVDASGTIWVGRYRLPWDRGFNWHVLAADGEWLGDMTTPAGVTVLDIGDDYLLGRHVDDLGVETVVVYDLRR